MKTFCLISSWIPCAITCGHYLLSLHRVPLRRVWRCLLCNLPSGTGRLELNTILSFSAQGQANPTLIVPRVLQPPNYPHGLLLDMFCLYWDSWPMYCPNWAIFCLCFSLFHFIAFLSVGSSRQGKHHPVFSSRFITEVNQISQAQAVLRKSMLVVPSSLLVWQACGSLDLPPCLFFKE